MAGRSLTTDTNNSPSFSVMLSMIDSAQVLTYDNVTAPGSFSDMVNIMQEGAARTATFCGDCRHYTSSM
eukprot:COSAG01_NODE_467_length_16597_cov_10.933446_5_plen_69_part_00